MRGLKITVLSLLILVLVPLFALILVAGTEAGTRFVFERLGGHLPPGVRIGRVEGRLADRLIAHDVEIETDGLQLVLARVEWHWTPSALWGGQLLVRNLRADGVRIVALPGAAEPQPSEPFTLPDRIDLPIAVAFERVTVAGIELVTSPGAEPVSIEAIELAGTFVAARLEIEGLAVRSPLLDLRATADVTAVGDYPLAGSFDWTLRPPDYPDVQGTTRLAGTLAELQIDQRLAEPYNSHIRATLTNIVAAEDPLHIAANAEIRDLDPSLLQADLPPMSLNVDLRSQGPLDALELDAQVRAEGLEQGTIDAAATALVEPGSVLIHQLTLTQPTHAGRLQAAGRVGFDEGIAADLEVAWQSMQWPLDDVPVVRSPRGELTFVGPPDDYRLTLAADLRVPDQPPITLELSGEGDLAAVALELRAATPSGRLAGRADLAWDPRLEARVELAGVDVDPEVFAAGWPGRIGFEVAAAGSMDADVVRVRIDRFAATGQIREQALALEARGSYWHDAEAVGAPAFDIEALSFALGDTRVDAEGRVADTADLRWRLDAPDLSTLLGTAGGRLSGTGAVTGSLPRPRIEAQLEGADLVFDDYALEQIHVGADLDLTGEAASSLTVDAQRGLLAGVLLERLQVNGSGTPDDHRLGVQLQSSDGDADVDLDGRLTEPLGTDSTWHFRLTRARLAYPELAPWALEQAAEGRWAAEEASVSRHCWVSGDARLCLSGSQSGANLDADFELNGLAVAYLAPFLPPGYDIRAEIDGAGSLRQRGDETPTVELVLETAGGEIALADGTEAASAGINRVRLEPSHARLTLLPQQAAVDIALHTEHGRIQLNASVPELEGADTETALTERPLSGVLSIDLPDLAFVAEVVPDLTQVRGAVAGNLDVAGTLASPVLTGRIFLEDGAAHVQAAGITLTQVTVDVEGSGGDSIGLSASATSGGGTLTLTGELAVLNEVPSASLRLRGQGFQATGTREARLYVSPDLEITAGAERIDVVGQVRIPRAEITPGTAPAAAVTASGDQILLSHEDDEVEREAARELHARVRIMLGNDVRFDGYGLTARFTGNLLAVQAPGAPTTGTGELNIVDGEYRAYGQGLVIETGNIYFAGGPLTEPALDIRAVRRPREGILVGAHVVGTLEEPRFTLFSEPSMSQQEQLSYLVLGRSLQEAPTGESSALSQAALSMGLRGGDFLARNIGERIGVDQLAIETGSGEAGAESDPSRAALVAGKYLSPRLYVSYGIGLFDPINVLRIQYDIADNWRVITQSSSEATGADIVYTIERGR